MLHYLIHLTLSLDSRMQKNISCSGTVAYYFYISRLYFMIFCFVKPIISAMLIILSSAPFIVSCSNVLPSYYFFYLFIQLDLAIY